MKCPECQFQLEVEYSPSSDFDVLACRAWAHLVESHPQELARINALMGEVGQLCSSFLFLGDGAYQTEQKAATDRVIGALQDFVLRNAVKTAAQPV